MWAGASWEAVCKRHPDRTTVAKVGMGRSASRVLHAEGALQGQLKLQWAWPAVILGLSVQRVPWQDS